MNTRIEIELAAARSVLKDYEEESERHPDNDFLRGYTLAAKHHVESLERIAESMEKHAIR